MVWGVELQEDQRLGEVGVRDNSMPFLGWGDWGMSPPFLMGKGRFITPESSVLRGTGDSREHSW